MDNPQSSATLASSAAPFIVRAYLIPALGDPRQTYTLYRVYFQGEPVGWQRDADVDKLNALYAAQMAKRTRRAA
jgi:hypothetical protein